MTPECPRTMLRCAADKAAQMGFEPRFALEYEVFVYYVDDNASLPSPASLTPVSRGRNAYSLVRLPALRAVFETFMQRMEEGRHAGGFHAHGARPRRHRVRAGPCPCARRRRRRHSREDLPQGALRRAGHDRDLHGQARCRPAGLGRTRPPEPLAGRGECVLGWRRRERDRPAVRRRPARAFAGAGRALLAPTSTRSGAATGSTGCPRTHPGATTTAARRCG